MQDDWKPTWNVAADLQALPLEQVDGFVLSRLDGKTAVSDLPALTGLPRPQVVEVLQRLVSFGAVSPPPRPVPSPVAAPAVSRTEPVHAEVAPDAEPPHDDEAEDDASAAPEGDEQGTHRQLFERELHPLSPEERQARAVTAVEPYLSAFCYDPVPAVVKALLMNPSVGLAQARLIAQHHRNPVGLDAVAQRAAFAQDAGVRRWLVRNPQLPPALFQRLFGNKRMLELFKLGASRDVPEGTRRLAREALRKRFAQGSADERVDLIFKTEGRALAGLTGIAVDGRTVALLCSRTYASHTLVQNIARWSAAPPALIAYLLKQESVRRSPTLRTLLQRHPNAPTDRSAR